MCVPPQARRWSWSWQLEPPNGQCLSHCRRRLLSEPDTPVPDRLSFWRVQSLSSISNALLIFISRLQRAVQGSKEIFYTFPVGRDWVACKMTDHLRHQRFSTLSSCGKNLVTFSGAIPRRGVIDRASIPLTPRSLPGVIS